VTAHENDCALLWDMSPAGIGQARGMAPVLQYAIEDATSNVEIVGDWIGPAAGGRVFDWDTDRSICAFVAVTGEPLPQLTGTAHLTISRTVDIVERIDGTVAASLGHVESFTIDEERVTVRTTSGATVEILDWNRVAVPAESTAIAIDRWVKDAFWPEDHDSTGDSESDTDDRSDTDSESDGPRARRA